MSELAARAAAPIDHAVRGRFNAWFFRVFDGCIRRLTAPLKQAAFAGIEPRDVVELGPGVGANLGFLPRGTRLLAVEPNLRMHAALLARCAAAELDVRLIATRAEDLPLADASVDDILCSLVLCTVDDPDAVLREVRRVLRPGGRFRFVEHVAAAPWTPRSAVQRAVRRPWAWIFEGCDPHRDTEAAIERAGFTQVTVTRRRLRGSVFYPVNTAIFGIATR